MPFLREDLARAWAGRDPFDVVRELDGEIYKDLGRRRTLRFRFGDGSYFLKVHSGIGWFEILKNWLLLRAPVTDARNEYLACRHLEKSGVRVPVPAAFAMRGCNPATRHSFLVCDAIENHISLATSTERWHEVPPSPALKRRLIEAAALLARRMHAAGVIHRDFYLYHLLADAKLLAHDEVDLALIDLHRARIVPRVSRYWRIRDLGALVFWCLDRPFGRRDWLRFVRAYEGRPLRAVFAENEALWHEVYRRAVALYRKGQRKGIVANRFDPDA